MDRIFLAIAGALGAAAVALGAFGAHALRARLEPSMLAIYQTGVQYHLVHTLAVGLVAWAAGTSRFAGPWTHAAGWLFVVGVVVFSGTLYLLALTGVTKLGMVTPLGGLCFIAGWVALAVAALRAS